MAPLLDLHRNDRHGTPQLHRTRRHARSNRRNHVHRGGSAFHRLLCRRFRLPRVEVEDEERRGVVLRQVRTDPPFARSHFCSLDQRRLAFV